MKHTRISTLILFIFLITILNTACKSYQPTFDVDLLFNEFDKEVDYIESDDYIVVMPRNLEPGTYPENAIIFYPGGLVDFHAYLPLMERCAADGTACYLVKMPFDFAFMDKRAAGKFLRLHPEIKNWYIAGHSLGGAMAASYLNRHKKDFKGLILLASFSTKNLSRSGLRVISIYGSNDEVLNKEHYQKNLKNLPAKGNGLTEIIIKGGNHSQFANYGEQEGDGKADISAEEQQKITADEISKWIAK